MGERPSMQSVQRSLIIGVLAGLIFGCIAGLIISYVYVQAYPPVYEGGAFPDELSDGYQSHYIAMVVDSYNVNQQVGLAQERLNRFDPATKIRALGERFTEYVANGQAVEAELTKNLAVELNQKENWPAETISAEVGRLATQFQGDPARAQAVNAFGDALKVVPGQPSEPVPAQPAPTTAPAAPPEEEPWTWTQLILYCVVLPLIIVVIVLLIGNWYFKFSRKPPTKSQVEWEGEGPAPIKQWTGTYTLGQDNYDEFFTIETLGGDFLGESGMGILEAIPGTSPKQVVAFDVGLFDKTDITTLSRVLMSEHAYNDDTIRAKIEINPQAEAVLAQPGAEFTLETSALRIVATVDEMDYGEGGVYFNRLTVTLNIFIREGADLKIGSMDVPEQFQS